MVSAVMDFSKILVDELQVLMSSWSKSVLRMLCWMNVTQNGIQKQLVVLQDEFSGLTFAVDVGIISADVQGCCC